MQSQRFKSRNLHKSDLLHNKQLEYISYKVREYFYQREEDKNRYREVCKKIKETIETCALKECMRTIFSSKTKMEAILGEFMPENNIPNFQYTPKTEMFLPKWDNIYYYYAGNAGTVDGNKVKIKKNLFRTKELVVEDCDGRQFKIPYTKFKVNINKIIAE